MGLARINLVKILSKKAAESHDAIENVMIIKRTVGIGTSV